MIIPQIFKQMNPIIFFWTGAISATLFLILLIWGESQTSKNRGVLQTSLAKQSLFTALAGSVDKTKSIPEKVSSVSLKHNSFSDKNGLPIDTSKYDAYVVKGNSMQFCHIHTDDVVFAKKGFRIEDLNNFPLVIVLNNDSAKENQCMYKIRRAWRVCSDMNSKEAFEALLNDIMASEAYMKLKLDASSIYDGDKQMIENFFEKFDKRYKPENPTLGNQIAISTTYNVKNKKIEFSIHKVSSIVGIVDYAFTLNGQSACRA